MQMTDSREIRAEPGTVWAAILDPEVLKACIPGCQELSGSVAEGFEAVVVQQVGPVKATFKGAVTVSDIVEGRSCTLAGEGKGGAAGFAKGSAKLRLAPAEAGTTLSYDVEARVGGKLAQLGSRLIDGFARKMADDFFTRFQTVVEGDSGAAAEAEAPPEVAAAKKSWLKRLVSG